MGQFLQQKILFTPLFFKGVKSGHHTRNDQHEITHVRNGNIRDTKRVRTARGQKRHP